MLTFHAVRHMPGSKKVQLKVTDALIETHGLTKTYGSFGALNGLDLGVMSGEIYGLLGPNGAGKTTTLRITAGLIEPTKGKVTVSGFDATKDPLHAKAQIGYVAEIPILYESLTPRELLGFEASVRGLAKDSMNRRVRQLAETFEVTSAFDTPIATLSMGTKQKVAIIAALLHQPPVLLLDEPLNSLDARSSRILKELLSLHVQRGGAVLFSTHVMEIAQRLCSRIGIIFRGKIVAEGDLNQLRARAGEKDATLEEVFMKLTNEASEVENTVRTLRESFFDDEDR
ncbi:MAG TPA: ABC transporter ATP-binding protein [Nitrososphaerales archaeon]|nr:ABC transporter ATP-binding protein [Nitrososphaerales archaeon]